MPREYYTPTQWAEKWKSKKPEGKYVEGIAFIVFITSVVLVIWSINIYRLTFIEWQKLIIPSAIGSSLFLIAFYKKLDTYKNGKYGTFFICIVCGGCLAHFVFMYTNKAFAADEVLNTTLPVIDKGRLTGKGRHPYVVVQFGGLEKQVMIDWKERPEYSHLYLEYSEGKFGYYVIRKKELVK